VTSTSTIRVHNVKGAKHIEHDLEGTHLYVIGGKNGQGKSSGGIDAFLYALRGKSVPKGVVRDGESEGSVQLILEGIPDTMGPHPKLVVTREFRKGKSASLEIRPVCEMPEDERWNSPIGAPQAFLDSLCGPQTFDPMAFVEKSPTEQSKILLDMAGVDLEEIDTEHKRLLEKKRASDKECSAAKYDFESAPFHEDAPDEEVSTDGILKQIADGNAVNASNQRCREELEKCKKHEDDCISEVERLMKELSEAESKLAAASARVTKGNTHCNGLVDVSIDALTQELATISDTNQKVAINRDRAEKERKLELCQCGGRQWPIALQKCRDLKKQSLSEANWPVQGILFDETAGVTYNGIPVANLSAAEQIDMSVALGAAFLPNLRTMVIRHGSLMDWDMLEKVEQSAIKHDCQLIVEVVTRSPSDESHCTVIIENGEIRNGTVLRSTDVPES